MNLPIKINSSEFNGTFIAESENSPVPGDLQRLIGQLQEGGARLVCALSGQSVEEIKVVEGAAK